MSEMAFLSGGSVEMNACYSFGGVVDLMGIMFDYPGTKSGEQAVGWRRTLSRMAE